MPNQSQTRDEHSYPLPAFPFYQDLLHESQAGFSSYSGDRLTNSEEQQHPSQTFCAASSKKQSLAENSVPLTTLDDDNRLPVNSPDIIKSLRIEQNWQHAQTFDPAGHGICIRRGF